MKRVQDISMFSRCSRAAIITALAIISIASVSQAQQPQHLPQPAKHLSLKLRPGNHSSNETNSDAVKTPYAPGWNYVHATNCELYDSYGYTYLILYPAEGGSFWTTSAPYQNLLLAACQTGNWVGLYIYDEYGDWSAIETYDYR